MTKQEQEQEQEHNHTMTEKTRSIVGRKMERQQKERRGVLPRKAGDDRTQTSRVESRPRSQLYLDAGQCGFSRSVCHTCGMVYSKGVASDERSHRSFCRKEGHEKRIARHERLLHRVAREDYVAEVTLLKHKKPLPRTQLLSQFGFSVATKKDTQTDIGPSRSKRRKVAKNDGQHPDCCRILKVDANSPPTVQAAALGLKHELVDPLLGTDALFDRHLGEDSTKLPASVAGYFVVHMELQRVLGCCFVRKVKQAFRIQAEGQQSEQLDRRPAKHQLHEIGKSSLPRTLASSSPAIGQGGSGEMVFTKAAKGEPSRISVDLLWVAEAYRRQGLATELVRSASQSFYPTFAVKKEALSLLQPTLEGYLFGCTFFERADFLVR